MNGFELIRKKNRIEENKKNIEKLNELARKIKESYTNIDYMIRDYSNSVEEELKNIWDSDAAKVFFDKISSSKEKYKGILYELVDAEENVKKRKKIISENTKKMEREYKIELEKYNKQVQEFNESRRY